MDTEKKTARLPGLRLISPLWVGLLDQECGSIPECLYDTPIEYEDDIREALQDFLKKVYSSSDLMVRFSLPEAREMETEIRSKVSSACLDISVIDERLYAVVDVETSTDLTEEELDAFMEQIEAQYRDGWGSAFEMADIPTSQGDMIYARLHHDGFELRAETADPQPKQTGPRWDMNGAAL